MYDVISPGNVLQYVDFFKPMEKYELINAHARRCTRTGACTHACTQANTYTNIETIRETRAHACNIKLPCSSMNNLSVLMYVNLSIYVYVVLFLCCLF